MITSFQPPDFNDALFDEQVKLVDFEPAKLKEILESGRITMAIGGVAWLTPKPLN